MKELIEKIVKSIKDYAIYNNDEANGMYDNIIGIIHEEAEAYNESVKGDLISRKETIQRFIYEVETSKSYMFHINTIKRLLQDIEKPTAYNDGWISCSERLPDKEGEYLVTLRRWNCVTFANFKDIKNNPHFDTNYVTAWQPLPAPYQPRRVVMSKASIETDMRDYGLNYPISKPKQTNFDICCESVENMAQIIDIAKCGWTKEQIINWLQSESKEP